MSLWSLLLPDKWDLYNIVSLVGVYAISCDFVIACWTSDPDRKGWKMYICFHYKIYVENIQLFLLCC